MGQRKIRVVKWVCLKGHQPPLPLALARRRHRMCPPFATRGVLSTSTSRPPSRATGRGRCRGRQRGGGGGGGLGKTTTSPTVGKLPRLCARRPRGQQIGALALTQVQVERGLMVQAGWTRRLPWVVLLARDNAYTKEKGRFSSSSSAADDTKIFACYEDGIIKAWDVESMVNLFDLQGGPVSYPAFSLMSHALLPMARIILSSLFSDYRSD